MVNVPLAQEGVLRETMLVTANCTPGGCERHLTTPSCGAAVDQRGGGSRGDPSWDGSFIHLLCQDAKHSQVPGLSIALERMASTKFPRATEDVATRITGLGTGLVD